MSRTLYRPMFRRGGSTGEGITSGLRQGYSNGGDTLEKLRAKLAIINQEAPMPEAPKSTAGSDFWLNLGTNILAQPGGRPLLQTLGTAGKEPLARYQQQRHQENLLDYKSKQGHRELVADLVSKIGDDETNKLWEEAKFWFKQGATNPLTQKPFESEEEAFDSLIRKSLMSKEKVLTPEGQWNTTYEDAMDYWKSEAKQGKISLGEAEILATHQADKKHKLPKALVDAMDPSLDYIDSISVDRKDGVLTINSIGVNFRYREGKIYLNLEDQQYYKLNADGKTFTVVDITDFQD